MVELKFPNDTCIKKTWEVPTIVDVNKKEILQKVAGANDANNTKS